MPRFQPILICKDYQSSNQDNFANMLKEAISAVADREVFLSPIVIANQPLNNDHIGVDVHQAGKSLMDQLQSGQAFAEKKAPYDPAVFVDIGDCGNPREIRTKALRAIPGVHRGFNVLVDKGVATRPAPSLILRDLRDIGLPIDNEHFEGLVFFNHNEARDIIREFSNGLNEKRKVSTVVDPFRHRQDSCLVA